MGASLLALAKSVYYISTTIHLPFGGQLYIIPPLRTGSISDKEM